MKIPEEFHVCFWSHPICCCAPLMLSVTTLVPQHSQSSKTYLFNSELMVGLSRVFRLYWTAHKVPSSSQSLSSLDITVIVIFLSISKGLHGQFPNSLKLFYYLTCFLEFLKIIIIK